MAPGGWRASAAARTSSQVSRSRQLKPAFSIAFGGAAQVDQVDLALATPPGAFALIAAVVQGVEHDAHLASGHAVGTFEEVARPWVPEGDSAACG